MDLICSLISPILDLLITIFGFKGATLVIASLTVFLSIRGLKALIG